MRRVLFCIGVGLAVLLSISGAQGAGGITRAEAAELIHSHAGAPGATYAPVFLDVPICHPQAAAVTWLAEEGITRGTGDGLFSPARGITAGELHQLLARYAAYRGVGYEPPPWSDTMATQAEAQALLADIFS